MSLSKIFNRDTILHLRIPFSFFLMPVFLFGISQSINFHANSVIIVFIALHLFIYPGSNIYNSYMDKDTGSIGGLEHPPPVTRNMYYASIIVDITGVLLCLFAGWQITLLLCGYIAFSKAYSWYGIRLKKYPYLGWLSVMFFQGGYTFLLGNMAAEVQVNMAWFTPKNIEAMTIASLIIGGSYPLTQIYQHGEDGERGDFTISYRLGIRGTFIFTCVLFALGTLTALHYFNRYYSFSHFLIFITCMLPVVIYFSNWMFLAWKNPLQADYKHHMWMNRISAICTSVCFVILSVINLL